MTPNLFRNKIWFLAWQNGQLLPRFTENLKAFGLVFLELQRFTIYHFDLKTVYVLLSFGTLLLFSSNVLSGQTRSFFNLPSAKFASNSIPIAHIPGGSGNGFATSVAGVHDPASTAILIALGKVMFTDVLAVASLESSSVMVIRSSNSRIIIGRLFQSYWVGQGQW